MVAAEAQLSDHPGVKRTEQPQDRPLRHEPSVCELLVSAIDALRFCPLAWPRSVLGKLRSMKPEPFSEYELFWRPALYLVDVLVPSLPSKAPSWVPRPFSWLFFHSAAELKPPEGDPPTDDVGGEQWFFINGILTNEDGARMNAAYLVELFHRPISILYNATDGPVLDLLECASEKLGARDADVDMAFHPLLNALTDPTKKRVVLIAHSQGTLITAVVLRLIKEVYSHTVSGQRGVLSDDDREAIRLKAKTAGLTVHADRLEPVDEANLAMFEVYCFANCATDMRYIHNGLPRIESFGNEHDLVARLGMLAPEARKEHIHIAGPCFEYEGAWGHLLNAHYLIDIDREQRQRRPSPDASGPYVLIEGTAPPGTVPLLFSYLNGAGAIP
ncbi:MAG: hypothetical protein ACTHQQ_16420 [Solirubrobacteraceae bacterium]